jgi:CSLREA domain-containing protein
MSWKSKVSLIVTFISVVGLAVLGWQAFTSAPVLPGKPAAQAATPAPDSRNSEVSQTQEQETEPQQAESESSELQKEQETFLDAARFRRLQLQDENGNIPPDGLLKAQSHIRQMAAAQSTRAQASGVTSPQAGGLFPGAWDWRGPGNIGGRIRSIVINPDDTQQMWVGSVSGGIWTTTDGGANWSPVNDFLANLNVSAMVLNPAAHSTLYAGTGEGFSNIDAFQGAGVFVSTDTGATWIQLANTQNWHYVNRVDISPNGNTLLVATDTNLQRSVNGGQNWTAVLNGTIFDVNFAPNSNSNAVASGGQGWAGYSINGGANWTPASILTATGRIEVAYAPSNPNVVYASIDINNGELWKSTDGGHSYVPVNTGNSLLGGQGWYDNIVWVDPTNENVVIVGGVELWRSTDGGATMTKINTWQNAPASAHSDQHIIVADPGFDGVNNKTVYFGNDGGLYKTDDVYAVQAGAAPNGWQVLNNNLGITQFYGGSVGPTGRLSGGAQDNGDLTDNFSVQNWTKLSGGDGGVSASDPTDANYIYGEYINLKIHRNTTGGGPSTADIFGCNFWNGSAWVCKDPPYLITDARDKTANFISPFILDPNNRDRLLGGGLSLWRSNDVRAANTATSPGWSAIKTPTGPDTNVNSISAIAVAKGNSDIVWVGHNNGDVYMTTDGTTDTPTWTRMDDGVNPLPNRFVLRITIDPGNSDRVYVTFGGYSLNNVWVTTNGGANWSSLPGTGINSLPAAPVRSLVIHPRHSNWLYVGTEVGVLASEDGGTNWAVTQQGPANVSADELFWGEETLYAATHGRGMYSIDLSSIVVNTTADETTTNGQCSLREAITNANDNAATYPDCMSGGSGLDTITFAGDGIITLTSALPNISDALTIDGADHTIALDGNHAVRGLVVGWAVPVTVTHLTIQNGLADTVIGVTTKAGGGILNLGTLTVTNSSFNGNSATDRGGGIFNNGALNVTNSTLFSNTAGSDGSGIYNQGTLNATNSTLFSNTAGSYGGGIENSGSSAILTMTNSTLSGNSATDYGSGLDNTSAIATFYNTLVSGNGGGGTDCASDGILTADGYNLDSDGTCNEATQRTTEQIKLGPLADNGGATWTMALLPGSAAIDAGDNAVCPATDQRGVMRPQLRQCDVGAFEATRAYVYLPLVMR